MIFTPFKPANNSEIAHVMTWVEKNWILSYKEKEFVRDFLRNPKEFTGFTPEFYNTRHVANNAYGKTFYWCDITVHLDSYRALY
jgi:hypothetical protein